MLHYVERFVVNPFDPNVSNGPFKMQFGKKDVAGKRAQIKLLIDGQNDSEESLDFVPVEKITTVHERMDDQWTVEERCVPEVGSMVCIMHGTAELKYWVAKVLEVFPDTRTMRIHWYGHYHKRASAGEPYFASWEVENRHGTEAVRWQNRELCTQIASHEVLVGAYEAVVSFDQVICRNFHLDHLHKVPEDIRQKAGSRLALYGRNPTLVEPSKCQYQNAA